MLTVIYIGSTAYVWFSTIKSMRDMDKRLKKEGYIFTSSKHFGIFDVFLGAMFIVAMSIPVFNLIFPLASRDKERSYDEYKNRLLDSGAIEEIDVKVDDNDTIIKINDSKLVPRINRNNHTYYSPLNRVEDDSIEEKGYSYRKDYFKKRY